MRNDINNRIEELKLLGWSENGAKVYSEKLLNQNISNQFISGYAIYFVILIISIVILITITLLLKHYRKEQNIKSHIYSQELIKISEKETIEKIEGDKFQSNKNIEKTPVFNFLIKEFKSITIKPEKIIEHFLLILILSYEFIQRLIQEIYKDYKAIKSMHLKEDMITAKIEESVRNDELYQVKIENRKINLMQKTNNELKSILKGVPYISKMNKKELIKKIISLEFKQNIN